MATLMPTLYHLDQRKTANWTITQEKTVSQDFPFNIHDETLEEYVQRTYLQFLWLPDSLMPLHLLIPSLRRVNVPSQSDLNASIHPMHALLEPLLQTTRSATNKYHVELPQILINGGGAGEMEETMMWYSVSHEKLADNESLPEHAEGPWVDEKWREGYLERMERREVQIQILLYLYKLSLPGPAPPTKKSRRRKVKSTEPVMSTEECLEAFMDRLSMWQLVGSLNRAIPSAAGKTQDRDWTQVFAEEIVERGFGSQLSEYCDLLRSKLFPSSPFSDDEDEDMLALKHSAEPVRPAISRAPSTSRNPSPAPSSTAIKPRAASGLIRSRSRSLSVSLAQEQQERERASAAPPKKRILNREVSMSRVFKPKPKPRIPGSAKTEAPPNPKTKPKQTDIILVEETPQKPRVASTARLPLGRLPSKLPALLSVAEKSEDADDEEWMMDSPPNVVLLNPTTRSSSTSSALTDVDSEDDDNVDMGQATPSKPSRTHAGR